MRIAWLVLTFGLVFGCSAETVTKSYFSDQTDVEGNLSQWPGSPEIGSGTYGIIQDILKMILSMLEGENTFNLTKLPLSDANWLENIVFNVKVDNISLKMTDTLTTINIEELKLPISLDIQGLYNFDELPLPGLPPLYGAGNLTFKLVNLTTALTLRIKHKSSNKFWTVNRLGVSISLDESKVWLDNLMDGDPFGTFLNQIINGTIPIVVNTVGQFIEDYNGFIMEFLSEILTATINAFLPSASPLAVADPSPSKDSLLLTGDSRSS